MNIWGHSKEIRGLGFFGIQKIRHPAAWGCYWLVLGLGLVFDQASKWIVTQSMSLGQSIPLLGEFLRLTYVRNTGAAFSLLAEVNAAWKLYLFAVIAITAFVVLTVVAFRERDRGWPLLMPLGMISEGSLGNLMDRLTTHTVVDFIELSYRAYHFPVFNVADSLVCVGVGWLFLTSWRASKPKPQV